MKKIVLPILVLICFIPFLSFSQSVKVVKFKEVEDILKNDSEKVRIVNFWATWCKPCVKELPVFETVGENSSDVEVILINLDFAEEADKVKRFVTKKQLKSKVILLDEIDYDTWIDKVSSKWSGAIPATLIISPNAANRKFVEGELSKEELEEMIADIL